MRVVFGASGTLGREVVARLSAQQDRVRAVSRRPETLQVPEGVERVAADVRRPDTVRKALTGAETVVCAIHGLAPPTRDNHPGVVDGKGIPDLIDQAASEGVSRLVLVSVRGAAPDAPDRFFRLKHAAEEHLRASRVPYTIVRSPAFIEVHALTFLGEGLAKGTTVRFIGNGDIPIGWVGVTDVAGVVADAITDPTAAGVTIDIDPVVVMTRLEALAILEMVSGRTARRSHLPVGMAKLIGNLGGLLNPGLGYLMETMASEPAARDSTAPADRHVTPSTTFDHVARAWANDLAAT